MRALGMELHTTALPCTATCEKANQYRHYDASVTLHVRAWVRAALTALLSP